MADKKIVYLGGAWEIVHAGHIETMKSAKSFGNYLIIGLNTNELVREYKHRECIFSYDQKKILLESIKYVDEVVPVETFSPIDILKKYNVNVYCLGDEWQSSKEEEINYMKSVGGEVRFLPRAGGGISTSEIKRRLLVEAQSELASGGK